MRTTSSQHGAALVSVIFLIVVVALLGTLAIRGGGDQQQMATLSVLEARANAAAFSGLEYATNRLKNNVAFVCPATAPLPAIPETSSFTVALQCPAVATGAGTMYVITATARHTASAPGNPDYVRRTLTRRVSRIGAGSW